MRYQYVLLASYLLRPLTRRTLSVSKLIIGANMAIPASCFCLALRLEGIASVRSVKRTHSDKRRKMLSDIAICVGLPLIQMSLRMFIPVDATTS